MPYLRRIILILHDILAFALTLMLSAFVAQYISENIFDRSFAIFADYRWYQHVANYAVFSSLAIFYFSHKGHYSWRTPWWQQVEQIFFACMAAFLFTGFVNYVLKTPLTRLWVSTSWVIAVPMLMLFRWISRAILLKLKHWKIPTVIIGGKHNAIETIFGLKSENYLNYDIQYVVLLNGAPSHIKELKEIHKDIEVKKQLGELDHRNFVIICPDERSNEELEPILAKIDAAEAKFAITPPISGFSLYGLQPSYFFGYNIILLEPKTKVESLPGQFAKRFIDLAGSSVLLAVLSPIMFFLSKKIREDGGPALFTQDRIGKNGKIFKVYKFRSMVMNAEDKLQEILEKNPEERDHFKVYFKLINDPRITPVGRTLRRTSLDELPQLINVWKGDMSLVGPRPILANELEDYGKQLQDYTRVKPGITGLWQVSGRNEISFKQRIYLDGWYVRNWSLWHDIVILIKTFFVVLNKRGAK